MTTRETLEKMTLPRLRAIVKKYNADVIIVGYSTMKKKDLIDRMLQKDVMKKLKGAEEIKPAPKKPRTKKEAKPEEAGSKEAGSKPPKTSMKFKPSKLEIEEQRDANGDILYQIDYIIDKGERIRAFIPPEKYLLLDTILADSDEIKEEFTVGQATFSLCKVVEALLKKKKLGLQPSSEIRVMAVIYDVESKTYDRDQARLHKYYRSLGFKKDGKPDKNGNQAFKQTIASFLDNCKKVLPGM